jgi:hypothetical protein
MRGFEYLRTATFTFLLLGFCGTSVRAGEFYYLLIFGAQSQPKRLRDCHTWATFVKAVGEGTDPNNYTLEANTISWVPASLDVKVWSPRPVPGMNMSLEQTLNWVYSRGENVTMWGPFRVGQALYQRSLEVRSTLEGGSIQYRAIDTAANLLISDCIHALAAVDPQFGRGHYPLIRIGNSASRHIASQIKSRSLFDQSVSDNQWLVPRLGLCRYPIEIVPPSQTPSRKGPL